MRTPADTPAAAPTSTLRLIIGYLAIVAVLPYLILKLMWISGSTVGILEPSPLDPAVVRNGNIVTAVMELIAIAVILAFTHRWGLRLPAWLVLVPAYVGIGLLAPFLITGPAVAGSVAAGDAAGDGSLAPWVGPLVYLGFCAQAIGIAASFALYVRHRWGHVLAARTTDRPAGPTQPVLVFMGWGLAALLALVVLTRTMWGFGATWGLSAQQITDRGLAEHLNDIAAALFAAAAVVGLLMLTLQRPRTWRAGVPIVLAWVGSGATLTSALYAMTLLFIGLAGANAEAPQPGITPVADLVQVVAGTATSVVGAVVLAELDAATSPRRLP
ncbi:hypothetical protein [Parenemella sanctibonifatiensis]|uniref:Uncharacterized protein n=1 Tax=Parenemella sanctibonifatiensis TaxID=2016505 RepID=A0A255ELK3_9ACTN|nr:hypothetical protein [Parenemella sanctibonifatiensis]OYN92419.1 hypothetical protein CGZ91_02690 [Parenemella sanctibonifatiensis]